jgi:hypothetical protein
MTSRVRATLRSRIRKALHIDTHNIIRIRRSTSTASEAHTTASQVDTGSTTHLPPVDTPGNQTISMVSSGGQVLTIDQQVHFYTQNNLIAHPLVSSALSYLGGLPPLLFIASEKEVLRDEVIYALVLIQNFCDGLLMSFEQRPQGCQSGEVPCKRGIETTVPNLSGDRAEVWTY